MQKNIYIFTFMHLADTFIQSNLQCIFYQYVCSLYIYIYIYIINGFKISIM